MCAWHWIPDVETPDLIRGRDDTEVVIAGLTRNPGLAYHWIPDVENPDLIRGRDDSY